MPASPDAPIRVGTAGWSVPRSAAHRFPAEGSHLERYARRFPAAEINSSFYRPHRPATYARWAASVPAGFRFAVKVPRTLTHERRLDAGAVPVFREFLGPVRELGDRLGPLLVQLPPSLAYDPGVAEPFLAMLRGEFAGDVVWEPRHRSWFDGAGDALLAEYGVGRVAADPAVVPEAARPGGAPGIVYYRLHGSPRVYYSRYPETAVRETARALLDARSRAQAWCIYDNTAEGAAADNALELLELVDGARRPATP